MNSFHIACGQYPDGLTLSGLPSILPVDGGNRDSIRFHQVEEFIFIHYSMEFDHEPS